MLMTVWVWLRNRDSWKKLFVRRHWNLLCNAGWFWDTMRTFFMKSLQLSINFNSGDRWHVKLSPAQPSAQASSNSSSASANSRKQFKVFVHFKAKDFAGNCQFGPSTGLRRARSIVTASLTTTSVQCSVDGTVSQTYNSRFQITTA